MRFRFHILVLVLVSWISHGATFDAASPGITDVQAAVNLCVSGDTALVTIATGTIVTNHWTGTLTNSGQNFTLQGPGPWFSVTVNEPASPNTYVSNSTTLVIVNDTANKHLISFNWSSNSAIARITGFTFLRGTNSPGQGDSSQGLITYGGICMNARLDNCHFFNIGQANLQLGGWINGVADHNVTWSAGEDFMFGDMPNWGGTNFNYGDESWAAPDSFGSTNAFYVESFVYTNGWNPQGIFDFEQGGRLVCRFGTFTNGSIVAHDVATGQRQRAARQCEVYCNHAYWLTNNTGQMLWPEFVNARGGVWYSYSNTVVNYNTPIRYSVYREQFCLWNPWGMANGTNTWDACSATVYDSGTYNGTDGQTLMLTDTTKSWTVNQWNNGYVVHNVTKGYAYGVVSTNDAHNITYIGVGSSCGITTNFIWNVGDIYRIYYLTNAIDQCGRGAGDLLVGDTPAVNSALGGQTYPRQALDPCYSWNNSITWDPKAVSQFGPVYSFPLTYPTVVTNRDYVDGVPAPGYTPLVFPHPLVSVSDPFITQQPTNHIENVGTLADFTVTATGTTPIYYQWYKGGVAIVGETNDSYQTLATCDKQGAQVFVVVSNSVSSVTSSTATLTILGCGGGITTINANTANVGTAGMAK